MTIVTAILRSAAGGCFSSTGAVGRLIGASMRLHGVVANKVLPQVDKHWRGHNLTGALKPDSTRKTPANAKAGVHPGLFH